MKTTWVTITFAFVLLSAGTVVGQTCVGDCNGDGQVSIDELTSGISLALGDLSSASCLSPYCSSDCTGGPGVSRPSISCLIRAVDNALHGCSLGCTADEECDDGNPCTRDECNEGSCVHSCLCV
jgi:hypothetical protein